MRWSRMVPEIRLEVNHVQYMKMPDSLQHLSREPSTKSSNRN